MQTQTVTKKKKSIYRRAYVQPNGYLKLAGRGRPSGDKKYIFITGEKLQTLLDGGTVKA